MAQFKLRRWYLLTPDEETAEQYPEIGRYQETTCYLVQRRCGEDSRYLVRDANGSLAWVKPTELVEELGPVHNLTVLQRAILEKCRTGGRQRDFLKIKADLGMNTDHMGLVGLLGALLDGPLSRGIVDRWVLRTRQYAKSHGLKYKLAKWKKDRHGKFMVQVKLPYRQWGYLTRTKVDGTYLYTLTPAGIAALV